MFNSSEEIVTLTEAIEIASKKYLAFTAARSTIATNLTSRIAAEELIVVLEKVGTEAAAVAVKSIADFAAFQRSPAAEITTEAMAALQKNYAANQIITAIIDAAKTASNATLNSQNPTIYDTAAPALEAFHNFMINLRHRAINAEIQETQDYECMKTLILAQANGAEITAEAFAGVKNSLDAPNKAYADAKKVFDAAGQTLNNDADSADKILASAAALVARVTKKAAWAPAKTINLAKDTSDNVDALAIAEDPAKVATPREFLNVAIKLAQAAIDAREATIDAANIATAADKFGTPMFELLENDSRITAVNAKIAEAEAEQAQITLGKAQQACDDHKNLYTLRALKSATTEAPIAIFAATQAVIRASQSYDCYQDVLKNHIDTKKAADDAAQIASAADIAAKIAEAAAKAAESAIYKSVDYAASKAADTATAGFVTIITILSGRAALAAAVKRAEDSKAACSVAEKLYLACGDIEDAARKVFTTDMPPGINKTISVYKTSSETTGSKFATFYKWSEARKNCIAAEKATIAAFLEVAFTCHNQLVDTISAVRQAEMVLSGLSEPQGSSAKAPIARAQEADLTIAVTKDAGATGETVDPEEIVDAAASRASAPCHQSNHAASQASSVVTNEAQVDTGAASQGHSSNHHGAEYHDMAGNIELQSLGANEFTHAHNAAI